MRARATAAGVTAQQALRLPRAARPRSRGPAALRPTCHQANARERLARRSSRPSHLTQQGCLGGSAPGMAGGRGDDLARAQRTGAQRNAVERSAAREQRASSSSGRAEQMAVAYPRLPSASPRSPATGRVALVSTPARPARLSRRAAAGCSREGWKPVRGETRSAARGLDAKHDSPAPRSGDAPKNVGQSSPSSHRSNWQSTTERSDKLKLTPVNSQPKYCDIPTSFSLPMTPERAIFFPAPAFRGPH
jgi:hypothetical protein